MRLIVWLGVFAGLLSPVLAQAGSVCDLLDEDATGCAAGECCYLDEEDAPTCVTGGEGVQDEACTASNDCACGHTCVGFRGGTTCARWCGTDEPDDANCPEPSLCITLLQGDPEDLGFVCRAPDLCNPLTQDCAVEEDGCYLIDEDGTTDCASAGGGLQEDECDLQNECAEGLGCADGACRRFCNPDDEDPGCDGDVCTPRGSTVPGGEDPVGYCGLPGGDSGADDGGCGCRTVGGSPFGGAAFFVAALLLWHRRLSGFWLKPWRSEVR